MFILKKRKRFLFTLFMTFTLLMSIMNTGVMVNADTGENKTDVLDTEVSLSQDGTELTGSDVIDATKDIVVKVDFAIPVVGDEPTPAIVVNQGDYALFDFGSDFSLVNEGLFDLTYGGVKVGEVNLVNNATTNHVEAQVSFNGDAQVYDGTLNTVLAGFSATLRYDGNGAGLDDANYNVTVLNKTFTVNVPAATKTYNLTKSGVVDLDNKVINWTINASVEQMGGYISLAGYSIQDDLTNVGELVDSSFKVNNVAVANSVDGSGVLNYAFTSADGGQAAITFQTRISDSEYYSQTTHTKNNSVTMSDPASTIVKSASASVSFRPQWITKSGTSSDANVAVYNPTDRTVTWTIVANDNAVNLHNVVIKDVLSGGLTFNSATWAKWDDGSSTWVDTTAITPESNSEYALGDISSKILLTIVANVPNPTGLQVVTGTTNYSNTATIYWTGNEGGIASSPVGVSVGYNAITKSGVANTSEGTITWSVNVNAKSQAIPDLKVYDLLIYGSSNVNLNQVTGLPAGIATSDLTQRTNQKYIEGSLTNSAISVVVHPLYIGGTQVGELLEFGGLSTVSTNSFSFKTLVTNPDIYAGNRSVNVYNTASLFSGNTRLNATTGRVTYNGSVLAKRLINFNYQTNLTQGLSHVTSNGALGFNYLDKTVVYYLDVNRNSMDLTNMANANNSLLGDIKVSDVLPQGWSFVELVSGQMFQLYEVDGSNNYTLVSDLSFLTSDFTSQSGQADFTFSQLDKHYVILVKAQASEDALKDYFDGSKTTTLTNNITLTAANHTFNPTVTASQNVQIVSSVLAKDYSLAAAGELDWTIDYKTYNLNLAGIKIEDTLPYGLELKTDSTGALVIDGNIRAYKLNLNADGSYSLLDQLTLVEGDNVFYDSATRTLTFMIEDPTSSYRFMYKTDITGEPGTISNSVRLYSDSDLSVDTQKSYVITRQDEYASFQKSGWIEVTKVNDDNAPLQNVEFTIYTSDGSVLRKGLTDGSGKIRFKVLPVGEYTLQETSSVAGYSLIAATHTLSVVKQADNSTVASIDGKTASGSNLITIRNYSVDNFGSLKLTKNVSGAGVEANQEYEFTITLSTSNDYDYYINGSLKGSLSSGDAVSLKAGDVLTIPGIEQGISYEVAEKDYSNIGLQYISDSAVGTITAGATAEVTFTNSKIPTGTLTLSKEVTGIQGDHDKKFEFTIYFKNSSRTFAYTGKGVNDGTVTDGSVISLASGQSITILDLPENLEYEIVEKDYSKDLYTTTSVNESGVIVADKNIDALFTNNRLPTGNLTVSKEVAGEDGDLEKSFEFTIYLKDCTDSFDYTGNGVGDGSVTDGSVISLAAGQSITIMDLPEGLEYEVVEKDYIDDQYYTASVNDTGVIAVNENIDVLFTNTKFKVGSLTLTKEVTGIQGDHDKKFEFTIHLKDCTRTFAYTGNGVADGTVRDGSIISLASGQSITIMDLPEDLEYEIVEKDYSNDLYTTTSANESGVIIGDENIDALFTNNRIPTGNLTVSKEVAGEDGDLEKSFEFSIYLKDCTDSFEYTGNGVAGGIVSNGSVISLASGQSITIMDLPEGLEYEIVEKDYIDDQYYTASVNDTGVIAVNENIEAMFTNTKFKVGTLTISKEVTGNQGDPDKLFNFTIHFKDCTRTFAFTGIGVEGGIITDGDVIALASGQSITICDLPENLEYAVIEDDYTSSGYTTTSENTQGTIIGDEDINAKFVNDKQVEVSEDGNKTLDTGDSKLGYAVNLAMFFGSLAMLLIALKKIV